MSQHGKQASSRPARKQQRRPLFDHLDDLDDSPHVGPPSPLGDLISDLDEDMPTKAAPRPRPSPPQSARPRSRPADLAAPPAAPRRASEGATIKMSPSRAPQRNDDDRYVLRNRRDDAEAYEQRSEMLTARPYLYRPALQPRTPAFVLDSKLGLALIALFSIIILLTLGTDNLLAFSRWLPIVPHIAAPSSIQVRVASTGDYTLQAAPSLKPEQIDQILATYGSPAVGTGQDWYELGQKYNIDPAIAVAFFVHESSAGTNPAWAGLKSDGSTTHNVGNIICAGYARCYGRFRDYASWREGIEDWYRLIDVEYIKGRGHQTIADVIPVYAPAFENDVQNYINVVEKLVDDWRSNGVLQ